MTRAAYERNGEPVSREAFYAIACDPRRSVAVEACAGAGKTWMLVSRILRALLDGARPHEILAITFTRKAAGEMRERLHQWLEAFATAPVEVLQRELVARGLSHEAAQADAPRLAALRGEVLAAGRPVQIRTFHGWFTTLLRNAPIALVEQLGLPLNHELLEDDSEAVALVWRRFHAALIATPELRANYEASVNRHGRHSTLRALEAALARRVEFALAEAQGVPERSVRTMAEQFPAFAGCDSPADALRAGTRHRTLLEAACGELAAGRTATQRSCGDALRAAFAAAQGDDMLDAVLAALLTKEGEPRKRLGDTPGVQTAQTLALELAQARLQHEAWLHQQRMIRLTRCLLAEYAALKRARGWVDMNDVELAARHVLGDEWLGAWMQERLDAQVRHLLVDEFQDTNPLQWQALHAWIGSYAGAGRAPGIFIVGDPKQSIYRFRRADPAVFAAAQAFVADQLGGDRLACDHTRRNTPQVLDVVNAVMGAAQAEGRFEGFRSHTTESTHEGAAQDLPAIPRDEAARTSGDASGAIDDAPTWRDTLTTPRELPEDSLRAREARQAARLVAQAIADGLSARDIMVLARKREPLIWMEDALREAGVPAEQTEKTALGEAPEVQDVVALLDALVSPDHDLALARALKSPLFGWDDAQLVRLAVAARGADDTTPRASWLDILLAAGENAADLAPRQEGPDFAAGQDASDFADGQDASDFAAAGLQLSRWKTLVDVLPPHDALEAIFAEGDLVARFAAAAPPALRTRTVAHLQGLMGASLAVDAARFLTPYAFVRALRTHALKAPAAASEGAVRLLTVHGAKGLEAALVIILDADAAAARAESMGVLIDWPGEASAPRRFLFLESESRPPACALDLLAREQAAREREELNALYVAMTRAAERLVVSSIEPYRAATASWHERLAPHLTPIEAPAGLADTGGADPAAVFVLPVLPEGGLPPARTSGLPDSEGEGEDTPAARIGSAMHRLLEWAAVRDTARQASADAAVPEPIADAHLAAVTREFRLAPEMASEAEAIASRILAGPAAWAWDLSRLAWHGNEVPLHHEGEWLRIDRLVQARERGEWWVLDYKSAPSPERQPELVAQLVRYRLAVRALRPGAVVRAAFIDGRGDLKEID